MKHLKTFLFIEDQKVAEEAVIYSSLINAGVKPNQYPIEALYIFSMTLKEVGRYNDVQIERIRENKLHIDAKINGIWQNVLIVEEVNILEMPIPKEEEKEDSVI